MPLIFGYYSLKTDSGRPERRPALDVPYANRPDLFDLFVLQIGRYMITL
ncbi:hypothetical protein PITCH_A2030052 [uncultured Desulfobacterium sp.]|uniref:Uncharacterized protein n=1 Tax=uncultured Desulfobacterium sp. TaxID=201089 RepID=A0A445MWR7_9BACT|nr:hypothetical protein PITCH_A2030052 [uncultured Desulfobacterium sp.]